jgi:glycogen operon protein
LRGTYSGLTTPPVLDHLTAMGITAVELLPVEFSVTEPWLARRGLVNYWGYSTIGFFAPAARYAATADPVGEFKRMVKDLHKAGLEVLIDVVYNHTAEGDHRGPTLCHRGIDNPGFYRLDPTNRARYVNWTGTGNTVDLTQPWVLRLVMDSLRYWVEEMHVDGFRFDLATTLGRGSQDFAPESGFLAAVSQDPVLRRVKLIAEPWDLGPNGYRLGGFPEGWAELNGRYRDDVRDFWRNTDGVVDELADRLTASSRIFGHRRPQASINFITSHDGFTLADLVSYNHKHNQANGEHNHDGHNDNRSWNSGHDGPTTDPAVADLRNRRSRTMLTTLFISQGVPMILGGDELGRSQGGNNNSYCQDNETSWINWEDLDWDLIGFVQRLARFRRRHPVFRQHSWLRGHAGSDGLADIAWFTPDGAAMAPEDWQARYARTLTVFLNGSALGDDSFLIYLNGREQSHTFSIPARLSAFAWSLQEDLGDGARPLSVVEEVPDFTVVIAAASLGSEPYRPQVAK